jgi:hypothetical protein
VLVKAPEDAAIASVLAPVLQRIKPPREVSLAVDIDPLDLL